MKKTITYFFTFISIACMAQVTIDQNNFPRKAGFNDVGKFAVPTGVALPTEGPAQVWDYSALVDQSNSTIVYVDATNDVNYPNALNYFQNNLTFQAFLIPSNTYEALDANGWYVYGRSTVGVTYSITQISGGTNDSLGFPQSNQIFGGRIDALKFPSTYPNEWTESRTENVSFELTIAAFFLNKTPGNRKRITTQNREVVGYGQLKIPKTDGSPSANMDVLLMKVVQTTNDSFFLGGALAPAPLLAAFGVSQGQIVKDSFYIFYKPDFGSPVLNINLTSTGQVNSVFYRPSAGDGSVSTHETIADEADCFPNPTKAGETIIITTSKNLDPVKMIKVTDIQGRIIFYNSVNALSDKQYQITIPVDFSPGLYSLQLENHKGVPVGKTKVLIH